MPEMSVIVLNFNGKHFLEKCLTALRGQIFRDFEAILVDNGSDDGSLEYVGKHFPEVLVLPLGRNVGFATGNNTAYELSKGELIILLNNDTEVDPHWLEEIHNASRTYPGAGIFASKMLFFDDRKRIDNCGVGLTTAGLALDLGRDEQDGLAWAEPCRVFGACGGAAAYRRGMLEDIGFLDDDFFMNYEDVDLSFRANLQGYECVFIPGAIVYHRLGATRKNHPARQVFFAQRNVGFVYLKNLPFGLMLRSLPQRLLYELGGAAYFFKMGVGSAFLKAKLDIIRQLPAILRKRKKIQSQRTITNRQLRSLMRDDWFASRFKKLLSAWSGGSQAAPSNPGGIRNGAPQLSRK
jgi:GT2 family glycosyltransferase